MNMIQFLPKVESQVEYPVNDRVAAFRPPS